VVDGAQNETGAGKGGGFGLIVGRGERKGYHGCFGADNVHINEEPFRYNKRNLRRKGDKLPPLSFTP
jgi:hypothetical protein